MRVLGLPGSLRTNSVNRRLLGAAARLLPPDAELTVFEGVGQLPLYDEDLDTDLAPPSVAALRDALTGADAVLIATPEYNSSLPGPLKNALDWASRPSPDSALSGKPVAVVGASPSRFGAVWAQAEVRKVAAAIGARVVEEELPVSDAFNAFDGDDRLHSSELEARFAALIDRLLADAAATATRGAA